jgi:hypothetical protein
MNWIFQKIVGLIPPEYSWGVATKKAAYMAGKGVVAILAYNKAQTVAAHLSPDQVNALQTASGALAGALLEGLHDYLKLKYPNATWL